MTAAHRPQTRYSRMLAFFQRGPLLPSNSRQELLRGIVLGRINPAAYERKAWDKA